MHTGMMDRGFTIYKSSSITQLSSLKKTKEHIPVLEPSTPGLVKLTRA
jgi:hypothetical protein